MNRLFKLTTFFILLSFNAISQNKLQLQDFFFTGQYYPKTVSGLTSSADGLYYTTIENSGTQIVKYEYKTGKQVAVILDLSKTDGTIKYINDYAFNSDGSRLLICTNKKPIYRRSFTASYYIYDFKNKEIKPLSDKLGQRVATFSPDGTKIAFVVDNNIYIHDLRYGSERQITGDGLFNHIINGVPDWVYEEEFGYNCAFSWAPDSKSLAFVKFDETNVREFKMNMFKGLAPEHKENELYPSDYTYKYPKAGETNSKVSVHVYNCDERLTVKMDIGQDTDIYIPRIRWTADPRKLAIIRLNRLQNKLEVLSANARTGATTILYRDENKYYIDELSLGTPAFLPQVSPNTPQQFVAMSEKDGYMHLYLFSETGKQIKDLTPGNYDVINYYGYDAKRKLFFYSSYETSSIEKHIYSVNLKGQKTKLSKTSGWNEASFSKTFDYYIGSVSNTTTPTMTSVYDYKGSLVRVLEDNAKLKNDAALLNLSPTEFITLKAADGTTDLNAWIIKPSNFDPNKEYPLLITQYSGPNSQEVKNEWSISWLNYLSQEGYAVACIDPRGTAGKGEYFRKCTYMKLGAIESDDMIAAASQLADYKWINKSKVGIWGWSFGGFMSSLCLMKGNSVFSTAIAVAPVTCWKYYDSIYTERFMRTPQENPQGYIESTPLNYAPKLQGNLLICHGTADDNVHIQNTYELTERLVQNGKMFDMAIYTNRNHGIYGGLTSMHIYSRFVNYLNEHLK